MTCPICHRTASYDPYFHSNICRQCGWTEPVVIEDAERFVNILELAQYKSLGEFEDIEELIIKAQNIVYCVECQYQYDKNCPCALKSDWTDSGYSVNRIMKYCSEGKRK